MADPSAKQYYHAFYSDKFQKQINKRGFTKHDIIDV